ncbi:MAG: hypothetical protein JOY82_05880 [Streptosporangiaceae bacterium]|nr:hypothetical protein [Streptosporangiaceae bacterium]
MTDDFLASARGAPLRAGCVRWRLHLVDVGVAGGVAAMQVLDRVTSVFPRLDGGVVLVAGCQCLPLLLRRRDPWRCWLGVLAGTQLAVAASLAGVPTTPWTLLALLVALWQLGVAGLSSRRRRLVAWLCAAGVAQAAALNIVTGARGTPGPALAASVAEDLVLVPGLMAGAWVVGGRLRESRARLAALAEARAADERRVALEVQARLARDLHDVAAHHLSSLVMQAEALRARAAASDRSAADALADTGRRAMEEMRALLRVLRADQPGSGPAPVAEVAPAPTLRDLPELVRSAVRGGQDVTADIAPGIDELPAAVSVTAYRVVQESLTNARRHAPGSSVLVRVAQDAGELRLAVTNTAAPGPPAAPARPPGSTGQGLAGMSERVRLAGGVMAAGPARHRGWLVSARLPAAAAVAAISQPGGDG